MLTLVLDSSAFLRDPTRASTAFRALARMCSAQLVRLCIPAIVTREVMANLRADAEERVGKLAAALDDLARRLPAHVQRDTRDALSQRVEQLRQMLPSENQGAFEYWMHQLNAEVLSLSADDTSDVLDGYFDGAPPFRFARAREDIPDAYILATLRRFAQSLASVHFVAGDRRLRDAAARVPGVQALETLKDFLADEAVASLIASHQARLNVVELLPLLARLHEGVELTLARQLKEYLGARQLRSVRIPSTGHEASVAQWGPEYPVELLWEGATFDGLASVIVPFRWMTEVDLRFRISANAAAMLPDSERSRASFAAVSSEEFVAERLFDMTVYGQAVVKLATSLDATLDDAALADLATSATIDVEGAPDVELSDVQDRHHTA